MLIVEDGTGLANAESYASIEDADAYTAARAITAWAGAANDAKASALRVATEYIDAEYGERFRYEKLTKTQALQFPRDETATGYVPIAVFRATIELAVIALDGPLYSVEDLSRVVIEESKGVGPLRKSVRYSDPVSLQKLYRQVDTLLRPLLAHSGLRTVRI